jgi:hypothetical protein
MGRRRRQLLSGQDLNEPERIHKGREITRLRMQYKSGTKLLDAFYKELRRRSKEYKGLLELKDPDVERMRQEITQVLERKEKDEHKEIMRIRGEFERKREGLVRKSGIGQNRKST